MLSRTAHYAISGVLRLEALPDDGYCRVEDLVSGTDAPRHAVAKVFQAMAQRGLLNSVRGSGGGFRLADGVLDLTLAKILEAVEGPSRRSATIIDRGLCLPDQPCALDALLRPVAEQLEHLLNTTTIRDLLTTLARPKGTCCRHEPRVPTAARKKQTSNVQGD